MRRAFRFAAVAFASLVALAGPARADSILERIAVEILSAKFGISTTQVVQLQKTSGLSVFDVAPVFSASSVCNARAERVWELRRQGLGWGQVAKALGMHPGTFNKLRADGAFDSARVWNRTLTARFEVTEAEVATAQRRGAKLEDIIAAIIVAKATGRSPQSVLDEHERLKTWEPIQSSSKVDFSQWKQYAKIPAPEDSPDRPRPRGKGHGKGGGRTP